MHTVKEIASILNASIIGDDNYTINDIATLANAKKGSLSFFHSIKYLNDLCNTNASAVLISPQHQHQCNVTAIVVNDPYLAFARIAKLFDRSPQYSSNVAKSAIVDSTTRVGNNTYIGPNVTIGRHCTISDNVSIESGSVLSDYISIGQNTKIKANVTICHDVEIGNDCIIHPSAVIGSDGFGNVKDSNGHWIKIPQLGKVIIADNVEIGASTTIDRGTIDDTQIKRGARIDNQVHIAHNVIIGENTAIAACTGIAGSTKIGNNCILAGQVGVSGHLEITDNVIMLAASNASKSILESGVYASGIPAKKHMHWNRIMARLNNLDDLSKTIKKLEKRIES